MATRLYQVLTFANVPAGGQATLAHSINVSDVPLIPDFLYSDTGGFTLVAANSASITVQNNNSGPQTLNLALEFIYSPARDFGQALTHLMPQPFWVSGGSQATAGLTVQNQGVAIPNNPHSTLNFTGPGVTASDAGAGVAQVLVGAAAPRTITVANTPYNLLSTDDYLFVDTSGGPITMILPDPTTFTYAKEYKIIDSKGTFGTNNLTLQPHGAEMIEGLAANKVFQTNWGGWTVVTDGTNWFIY